MRRRLATFGIGLSLLVAAPTASALTDQERWHAHQELTLAQDLRKKGDLQEALTHYLESARLDPKLVTLMELGELEEQLGKLSDAQQHFVQAAAKAQEAGATRSKATAEERASAIENRFAHLTLQPAADLPAGTQVFRDEAMLDAAALTTDQKLAPGPHVIIVKAPEHAEQRYDLKLADGEHQTLSIAAGASTAPPPPPPKAAVVAAPPPPPPPSSSGSSSKTLGIIAGSVGIVGLGAGVPLWYLGYKQSDGVTPAADQQVLIGQIATIGGGALLLTGIVLLATAPSNRETQARLPVVVPTLAVDARTATLGAVGRF